MVFLSDGSFPQLAACVCASLGTVFPELLRSQDRVHSVLLKEEQQFTRTLDKVFLGIEKATICLRQNDSVAAFCVGKSSSLNRKARPTSTGHLPRAFQLISPPFFFSCIVRRTAISWYQVLMNIMMMLLLGGGSFQEGHVLTSTKRQVSRLRSIYSLYNLWVSTGPDSADGGGGGSRGRRRGIPNEVSMQ